MKSAREAKYGLLRSYFSPGLWGVVFMVGVLIMNIVMAPRFISLVSSSVLLATPLIFLGLAEIFVLIVGEVDLSVGAGLTLVNAITVCVYTDYGIDGLIFLLVPLATGLFIGLVNGLLVAFGRLNSFLATIATASLWTGVALFVLGTPRGSVPFWFSQSFVEGVGGIPMVVVLILLAIGIWLVFRFHSVSNYFYASGSNARAAFASGIGVNRMKFYAFALNGLMVGLGGLAMTGMVASGDPRIGLFLTLVAILAALIGGASFSGGRGDGIGVIGAAIGIQFMRNLIFSLGVAHFYQDLVYGVVILALIATCVCLRRRKVKW